MEPLRLSDSDADKTTYTIEPYDTGRSLVTCDQTGERNVIPNRPLILPASIVRLSDAGFTPESKTED